MGAVLPWSGQASYCLERVGFGGRAVFPPPAATLCSRPVESGQALEPLPFHRAICDFLEQSETPAWEWFASAEARSKAEEHLQLELLKRCVRLDSETFAEAHACAAKAAAALDVTHPITLYQAEGDGGGMNAALFHLPEAAHVVLSGPVLERLEESELVALFAHELAHHVLYLVDGGRYLVADRMLNAIAADPRASEAHIESCRRYRLYTEIFADRGSQVVSGFDPAVSCLVKVTTGLKSVSPAKYLEQAKEIVARGPVASEEYSHPETFIRTLALDLWTQKACDVENEIRLLIAGLGDSLTLDMVDQKRLTEATEALIAGLLAPEWIRSDTVMAQARSYSPDLVPLEVGAVDWDAFSERYGPFASSVKTYLALVLLDFALADPDLDDYALAACLQTAEALDIGEELEVRAYDLGKVPKKRLKQIKTEASALLSRMRRSGGVDGDA